MPNPVFRGEAAGDGLSCTNLHAEALHCMKSYMFLSLLLNMYSRQPCISEIITLLVAEGVCGLKIWTLLRQAVIDISSTEYQVLPRIEIHLV